MKPVPFKSLGAVSYSSSIVTTAVSVASFDIFSVKEGFVQGHWKWHYLIDRIRVPISVTQQLWRHLVSFARYRELLVENREIFIPNLYLVLPQGRPSRNFANMFDGHKTRMIGLPCGE